MNPTRQFAALGEVTRAQRTARGALLELGAERFRLDVIRADILRMKLTRGPAFEEAPTESACFSMPAPVPFELSDTSEELTLRTRDLCVTVTKRKFSIAGQRSDGSVLFEGTSDPQGESRCLRVLNDEFLVERRLSASDRIYGLGQKTGRSDRRGRRFVLWNLDVLAPRGLEVSRLYEVDHSEPPTSPLFDPYYTSIPFFHHFTGSGRAARVAGFFVDNPYKAHFDFTNESAYSFHFSGGQYTEYVFAGPTLQHVLEAYTFITGRMALPPLWSLGHQQCRWHDYEDAGVLAVAREYRRRGIPCDGIWFDIGHMDGFRVFTWHPQRFPDPRATLAALRAEGFHSVTIIDPGLKEEPGYAVFDEARRDNLLCKTESGALYTGQVWPGRTVFPDFSLEAARVFWAARVRDHAALGLSGIWNDMNEPATGEIEPFAMRFDRDGANHSHERYHNQYALAMALATKRGLLAAAPDSRPFILSRAGSAGIQRVAAQWLGDNCSRFEHLAMSIPMALGMGLSGQPFVGADIPGFGEEPSAELAARWFQCGALLPFCRCHNSIDCCDQYPWSFGPEVEEIARRALSLRYRLLPYLYTLFRRASVTGEPIARPSFFDFPEDPDAHGRDDQFLLGPGLLAAPVITDGARTRTLYLPDGTWFDWDTNDPVTGGRLVTVDAPLEKLPLFARAGAVIPLLEAAPPSTLGLAAELLELHLFPPEPGSRTTSNLYEDDGKSFAYRTGAFLETSFSLEHTGSELLLTGHSTGAPFPELQRHTLRIVPRGVPLAAAYLNGQTLDVRSAAAQIQNRGESFELRLVLHT